MLPHLPDDLPKGEKSQGQEGHRGENSHFRAQLEKEIVRIVVGKRIRGKVAKTLGPNAKNRMFGKYPHAEPHQVVSCAHGLRRMEDRTKVIKRRLRNPEERQGQYPEASDQENVREKLPAENRTHEEANHRRHVGKSA